MKTVEQLATQTGLSVADAADVRGTMGVSHGLTGVWTHNGRFFWRSVHAPEGAVFFSREEVFADVDGNGGLDDGGLKGGTIGPEGPAKTEDNPEGPAKTEEKVKKPKAKASEKGGGNE